MAPGKPGRRRAASGFTYVAMLCALAIFGLGLAALGQTWSAASQRDKEAELIRIGSLYVRAIGDYHARSPGSLKSYPVRLDDLLEDTRFVGTMRHLRKLYGDPVNHDKPWTLLHAPGGGIIGVASQSDKRVLRQRPLNVARALPVAGVRYSEWHFIYDAKP